MTTKDKAIALLKLCAFPVCFVAGYLAMAWDSPIPLVLAIGLYLVVDRIERKESRKS